MKRTLCNLSLLLAALLLAVFPVLAEETPSAAEIVGELTELEFELPVPGEEETLYVGKSAVSQVEGLYMAFALSADGTQAGGLHIYFRNFETKQMSAPKMSISLSGVYAVGPDPVDIDLGSLKLKNFYAADGVGGCEMEYTFVNTLPFGQSLEIPIDPASFRLVSVPQDALPSPQASVPAELAGTWSGTGTPKGRGNAIDLTVRIEADGSGEYTFIQDDYTESYPFTVESDGQTFSVDIPADNTLGISACGGTWALEDGVLTLDITTTFANGGSYY